MTRRHARRDEWRKTNQGTWTMSLGHRGERIRLFENGKGGMYYREVYLANGTRNKKSLGTYERDRAEQIGREIYARILTGTVEDDPRAPVRLEEVATRFVRECARFLDNKPSTQTDGIRSIHNVVTGVGANRDVRSLTPNDLDAYATKRRRGGVKLKSGHTAGPVGATVVQGELKLLKQMLSWATTVVVNTRRWIEYNPVQHYRCTGETDVRRPVATIERFQKTIAAMHAQQDRYLVESVTLAHPGERDRAARRHRSWMRAELGLMLLEATGRRRGAVMGLKWDDIDFDQQRITWVAEFDKKGRTSRVPYPASLFEQLRLFQERLHATTGFCWPREDDPSKPAPPELLYQRMMQAERDAGLPKLEQGGTHPYRRKWRSERSGHSLKAVAEAGGWRDMATMERCYDIPEDDDLLRVTAETRKRGVKRD